MNENSKNTHKPADFKLTSNQFDVVYTIEKKTKKKTLTATNLI